MKEIKVQINPCLELINSILLTSRYNELTKPYIGYGLMTDTENEYTYSIKSFFQNYKNHKIYEVVENMIPHGFTFSRPVEIALSLDSRDLSIQFPLSPLCIEYSGGILKINELLELLKDFVKESNYFSFFESKSYFYDAYIKKANQTVRSNAFVSILENEFGKQQNSYNFVISSLMKGNFGICFQNSVTKKADIFSVFSSDDFSLSPAILLHEYSHSFINPLTEKYHDIVQKYQETYEILAKYKLPNYLSGYEGWEECVNEHLVRAMTIYILRKCQYTELADQLLNNDLYHGYRYIPQILEKYKYYDSNRNVYANFECYYPILLNVFSNYIASTE